LAEKSISRKKGLGGDKPSQGLGGDKPISRKKILANIEVPTLEPISRKKILAYITGQTHFSKKKGVGDKHISRK